MGQAKLPSNRKRDGPGVVVDERAYEAGDVLCFHDPRQVATTVDMVEIPESEARKLGAVGCSTCYRDVDCTDYQFPYKQEMFVGGASA